MYAVAAVLVASVAKVAFSVRLALNIFWGKEPAAIQKHFHTPPLAMQLPPLMLAAAALLFGVWPALLEPMLKRLAAAGLNPEPAHLALWHGFTRELFASLVVTLLGLAIYAVGQKTAWRWASIPSRLRADLAFESGLIALDAFCHRITQWLRFDRPMAYLPIILSFIVALLGGYLWIHYSPLDDRTGFWHSTQNYRPYLALRIFVAVLMGLSVLGVIVLKRWTTQLIFLSVSGFLVTFYYVLYQAPDLALTQILVDTVSLLLILILLGRFHRSGKPPTVTVEHPLGRQIFNGVLSLGVALIVTCLILIITAQPHPDPIGQRFLDTTVDLAKGTNAVNTILVDYRGFDTLFEIHVLFIAMLAILGLVSRHKRTAAEMKQGPLAPPGFTLTEKED